MEDTRKSEIYQRWDDGFLIRRMRSQEGRHVQRKWMSSHRPTMCELEVMLEMRREDGDVDGFYIGELNGEMIASLVMTSIADDLKYLGLLFVVERYRQSGFASRMMTTAHDIEHRRNYTGFICMTTASNKETLYAKFGYQTTTRLSRYVGVISTKVNPSGHGTDVRQVG